jgi:hypothetical protein
MTDPIDNPEIGRQLSLADLEPLKVVVVKPPGSTNTFFTLRVMGVEENCIAFRASSPQLDWTVINFIKDGKIYDDRDREVLIYEYLGED